MKFNTAALALSCLYSPVVVNGFVQPSSSAAFKAGSTKSKLNMVLEMPKKQISKLEQLKVTSDHLTYPLIEVRTIESLMWQWTILAMASSKV